MIDYEILQDIITDHELCKVQENELAKVVELLKADRLIELPCKVGDTAWTYTVSHGKYEIYDVEVVHEVFATHIKRLWGDRYFATKEEAEAKLKGSEE
jgi:hypothetical protein